jgi:hypothetical protein
MIVPAGPAQNLRQALSGGVSSDGSTVHVHHATNFNISSLDSGDVKRWIKGNGKEILRTINEGVRLGTHLGLKKLSV